MEAVAPFSHSGRHVDLVVARGICQHPRPDNAADRPGEPCGMIHTRCAGHVAGRAQHRAEGRGNPCGVYAIPGQATCRYHNLTAATSRATGEERATEAKGWATVGALLAEAAADLEPGNEIDAFTDMLTISRRMVRAATMFLADLPTEADATVETVYDEKGAPHTVVTTTTPGLFGPNSRGEVSVHVAEKLLGDWVDRQTRIEKAAADIGLETRRIALEEATAKAVVLVVQRSLARAAALGIGPEDPAMPGIVATEMRAIEATATTGP